MWISKIELTNFKSYQHAQFEFPAPAGGKNIVLIGGLNGYGKTSILEALYLGLYGKDAISHLARAGLADDSKGYPSFLERAFNGQAKRDGQGMMAVRVVINKTGAQSIDIRRSWHFKSSSGQWTGDDEAVVREVSDGVCKTPKKDGESEFRLSDMLDNQFVPAHIAPFFFFDGEEVKKLADQSRIEQVKLGLEGLFGIVLLRTLADRLKSFEARKRATVSSVDEENIERLLAGLTQDEQRLDVLRKDGAQSGEKLRQLKADRDSRIEHICTAGGGGGDIATVKTLIEQREGLESTLRRDVHKSLERILADKLPFHLVPRSILADFRSQLQKEIALAAWLAECRALQPKRTQFEAVLLGAAAPEISPELTAEQIAAIKDRIGLAWASLFHPPPSNCAENMVHAYLHEGLRERTLRFLDSLTVGQQDVQDLLTRQRSLNGQISDLKKKIARVEGIDRDGTLAQLRKGLELVAQQIEEMEARIRDNDRNLVGLETTVNNTRSRYLQEKKRRDDSSPVRQLVAKSERVRAVIDEVVPILFPLKVTALAGAMTKVYKQLAHKNQVGEIDIKNDGTTVILDTSGKEIVFDRSAGENQIFATALIAGLAEVSGVKAPMLVDTPLGRLDSRHRENILKFWTGASDRQIILLSQDKEIDPDFYDRIRSNVCATYLLEHADMGDGIGRTTIRPGAYFGAST